MATPNRSGSTPPVSRPDEGTTSPTLTFAEIGGAPARVAFDPDTSLADLLLSATGFLEGGIEILLAHNEEFGQLQWGAITNLTLALAAINQAERACHV